MPLNPTETEAQSAAAEVRRGLERIEGRLERLEALLDLRLTALEKAQTDHETRLRAAQENLVRLTAAGTFAQAANAALALLLSALAAWLGTR